MRGGERQTVRTDRVRVSTRACVRVCVRACVCVCVCVARGAEAGERRRGKLAGQHRHVLGPLKTVPRVDNMYKCYV